MIELELIKKRINERKGPFLFDEALGLTENAIAIRDRVTELEETSSDEDTITDNLVTLSGVAANEPDLGTFTGSIIANDSTVKVALQALETDLEALQTTMGVAAEATSLGTFTGTTIADNSTVKVGMQALETSLELGRRGVLDATGANTDNNLTNGSAISVTTTLTTLETAGVETRTLAGNQNNDVRFKIIRMENHNGNCTIALTNVVGSGGTTATFDGNGDTLILMSTGAAVWTYLGGSATIS
jgi:hypothetical protein